MPDQNFLDGYDQFQQQQMVLKIGVLLELYGMTGSIAHWVPKEMRETFRTVLKELEEAGHIVFERGEIQSCMIYVPFKRWHGNDRAKCLR